MAVLLAPDTIAVSRTDTVLDAHGWAEETGSTLIRTVKGSIQEQEPSADSMMMEPGGQGPNRPFHQRQAIAYLSEGVEPGDGLAVMDTAHETTLWQVQRCRLVEDPRGGGHLNVWVADCVEVL